MDQLRVLAKENQQDCQIWADAYSIWLIKLKPANWVLVFGAALLSLIAATSLFFDQGILTVEVGAALAFISAILTLLHKFLNCDPHQAECKKLRASYESLVLQYNDLMAVSDPEEYGKKLESINAKRVFIRENATAQPLYGSLNKARRVLESGA